MPKTKNDALLPELILTDAIMGVKKLIHTFDDDPLREGLQETPARYVKMLQEFLNPEPFKYTLFENENCDEMIVVDEIPFFSLCEHHLVPFFGTASIAYIPGDFIVGLSKLPRALDKFARRFQNQERITTQLAEELMSELAAKGVGIKITARHLCVEMRGVKKHGVMTTTCALLGNFKEPQVKAEFFAHLKK